MRIVDLKPGLKFPDTTLKTLLPDVESALFFGKLYQLDAWALGELMYILFKDRDVVKALVGEGDQHSIELQDYLVDIGFMPAIEEGGITFSPDAAEPKGVILPEVWKTLEIEIADSIQQVADKLKDAVGHMPGKHGSMVFKSMAVLNSKRPTIGDYRAHIHHPPHPENLVVLDVSGSMTEEVVERILEDVVAMSYEADAHFAVVSNTTTVWEPGRAMLEDIKLTAEYGGTHYETLLPLFEGKEWGTVVCIADYDSSWGVKPEFEKISGSVGQVLDISLVSRPTYLGECVGVLSDEEVKPLMVAATDYTILNY